jgi:hypothetical protein
MSARPICPRALIHARRNAVRGAGNTSSASTMAKGTSVSGTSSAGGAARGPILPP